MPHVSIRLRLPLLMEQRGDARCRASYRRWHSEIKSTTHLDMPREAYACVCASAPRAADAPMPLTRVAFTRKPCRDKGARYSAPRQQPRRVQVRRACRLRCFLLEAYRCHHVYVFIREVKDGRARAEA